jgi:C1A family cysteine protease
MKKFIKYGWIPDVKDHRDIRYQRKLVAQKLPASIDLTADMPTVYDQEELGSCTANAIAGAFEYLLPKEGKEDFTPSRLFIYYNEREKEGTVNEDSGAQIRDGIKVCTKLGVCKETTWPYIIQQFAVRPSDGCYTEALDHQVLKYERLSNDLADIKHCLASGYPVVFGFTVYENFESAQVAKDGMMPMPGENDQVLGGHAVLAVGYDDATKRFKVRNSWGTSWGDKGYFYMPYDYLTNSDLAQDFWAIRLTE